MPALLLSIIRLVRLLLSGHQAIAIENAALRLQLAAFQRNRKRPIRLAWFFAIRTARYGCAVATREISEILGPAVETAAPAAWSPRYTR
jgi:hypothetical protein